MIRQEVECDESRVSYSKMEQYPYDRTGGAHAFVYPMGLLQRGMGDEKWIDRTGDLWCILLIADRVPYIHAVRMAP